MMKRGEWRKNGGGGAALALEMEGTRLRLLVLALKMEGARLRLLVFTLKMEGARLRLLALAHARGRRAMP